MGNWACVKCDKEYDTAKESASCCDSMPLQPKQPKAVPKVPLPKTPEEKPVKLEYKYAGTCECKNEVKTLFIEKNKTKQTVIAYCVYCDKQLKSREVLKL